MALSSDYFPPADIGSTPLYEDDFLLVVDKPSGLLSVPGRGDAKQDCLISRLNKAYPEALIVHRLDMSTSGLLVLARSKEIHRQLSGLFQDRRVQKSYVAKVSGRFTETQGEVDLPLITDWVNRPLQKVDFEMGKPSLTRYKVVSYDFDSNQSRVVLFPQTGRTHQLRVHMLAMGHPILGDALYAPERVRQQADRLCLHAQCLAFTHPKTGDDLEFESTAPF